MAAALPRVWRAGSSDRLQMSPVFISDGDQLPGSGVAAALIPS